MRRALGFWNTNVSRDPGQTTRPCVNKQEEKNLSLVEFAASAGPQSEKSKNTKRKTNFVCELKKKRNLRRTVLLISWHVENNSQSLGTNDSRNWKSEEESRPSRQQYYWDQLEYSKKSRKPDLLVVLFYGVSTLFEQFNTELSHFDKHFKQFNLVLVQFFVYSQLNVKTVLFQTFQFGISTQYKCQNSSISNNPI